MADERIDMADRDIAPRLDPRDVLAGPATAWYPAGAGFGPRRLDEFEFVWLLSGSARWESTGHPAQHLTPGQLMLVPPGVVDRFRWDGNGSTSHAYVHFRLPGTSGRGWPLVRTLTSDDPLDGLLRYLLWLAGSTRPDARARIADVLALAVDVFVHGPWPDAAGAWPPPMVALAEAVAAAWSGGMRPVTLDQLAAASGFSRGHLSRSFRALYGVGVVAGLERLRLDRARVLLRRSDLTVAQIARLCGYPDPLHFSRRFRAVHGCPPSACRDAGAPVPAGTVGALHAFATRVTALSRRPPT